MTRSPAWWRLVAARELTTRLRDRTFLVSTGVLLLLVVGAVVVTSLIGGRPSSYDVAVTDPAGERLVSLTQTQLRALSGEPTASVDVVVLPDAAAARAAVVQEHVDAALLPAQDGFSLVAREQAPGELSAAARSALSLLALQDNAERAGTTVAALTAGSTLTAQSVTSPAVPDDVAGGVGFLLALLFFATAIGFGVAIAQSVVVEKQNRIVEILAAAMPVRALLWGKVVGNSALALAQVLAIAVAGGLALLAVGELDALPEIGLAGVWFLAFFVVGFLALASLWAVAGSLATRQEDLQATTLPGQALLMVPYLVAVTGNDTAIEIASFVPIASSMTMPARLITGELPWWQPVLSLVLAGLAAGLLIRLGARWYERALLQTSRRTTYRELLRRADA